LTLHSLIDKSTLVFSATNLNQWLNFAKQVNQNSQNARSITLPQEASYTPQEAKAILSQHGIQIENPDTIIVSGGVFGQMDNNNQKVDLAGSYQINSLDDQKLLLLFRVIFMTQIWENGSQKLLIFLMINLPPTLPHNK